MFYAQLTGFIVTAVTQTAGPIVAADMIEIASFDIDLLGKTYNPATGEFA